MSYIGIDLGGTSVKSVLLSDRQTPSKVQVKHHTRVDGDLGSLVSEVVTHLEQFRLETGQDEVQAIGFATPGPLDSKRTQFLSGMKPELKFLENINLTQEIKKALKKRDLLTGNLPLVWENDANLFTYAESVLGAAQGAQVVLGLTLGTGVGGGLVLSQPTTDSRQQTAKRGEPASQPQIADRRIYVGAYGGAGEVGHMSIQVEDGLECYCGRRGCLEQYTSAQYLKRFAHGATVTQLHQRARSGDKVAQEVLEKMGHYLGIGLVSLVNLVGPEIIVLGGGLMEPEPNIILQEAVKFVRSYSFSPVAAKKVKIVRTELGYYSGAIGAALYAKQQTT